MVPTDQPRGSFAGWNGNFVKGMGCFLCWLNISVQIRFGCLREEGPGRSRGPG